MKCTWMLAALLAAPPVVLGQSALPSGTILPLSLDKKLDAHRAHPGQEIRATVMQDIPGTAIRRRARVVGHVVRAAVGTNGKVSLEIQFDQVQLHGATAPVKADLRALASYIEIEAAQDPEDMSSRGLSPESWTTKQIGGDQVYRGGGPVAVGTMVVGEPVAWGVLATPRTQPGQPCRGVVGENTRPQALWLFSSDACGVYGYDNIRIEHSGRTDPEGSILFTSSNGMLTLNSGSGLLLRVF